MQEKIRQKKKKGSGYRNFIELVLVGSATGIFAGAVVTFFSLLVHEGEEIARDGYAYVRANPQFLPLLFLTLFCGAFLVSVFMNLSTVIRGGGVPQAEGASRGNVPLKWWRDLSLMFAATLANVFMGLSIGAEGPCVLIGACSGDGVSKMLKRNKMITKYQITGGACAGLAVAMNAPLTGMAFAFEEAHKRFTPEVFICAFTSVIFGMLTRIAISAAIGKEVVSAFSSYFFYELPVSHYGYVALAGLVCSVLGVIFYKLCFAMRKAFRRINAKSPRRTLLLRTVIVAFLGGIVSLISVSVMGGGSSLIEGLGTLGGRIPLHLPAVFGLTFVGSIVVILILKFFVAALNVGAGIPCGMLIPLLAIGACVGALLNEGWLALGMDSKYCDIMIMICMAALFTTVVKAPITAIVMICEFTGSFAPLLPVIIAVFIGYIVGEMAKTDGIYEELLVQYERETGVHERAVREMFTLRLLSGALADGKEVRDILWPSGAKVTEIRRGEEVILPDGETVLRAEDVLVIVCKTFDPKGAKDELDHILG